MPIISQSLTFVQFVVIMCLFGKVITRPINITSGVNASASYIFGGCSGTQYGCCGDGVTPCYNETCHNCYNTSGVNASTF